MRERGRVGGKDRQNEESVKYVTRRILPPCPIHGMSSGLAIEKVTVKDVTRSILPPYPIHGMRGSRKTTCSGLAITVTDTSANSAKGPGLLLLNDFSNEAESLCHLNEQSPYYLVCTDHTLLTPNYISTFLTEENDSKHVVPSRSQKQISR